MNRVWALGILLKPKVVIAMAALYTSTYICSSSGNQNGSMNTQLFINGLTAVLISVAGANAINCYYDRDIDSIMKRTLGRSIAIDILGTNNTLAAGILLIFISAGLSINIGTIPFILLVLGVSFYLIFYTVFLKRRTIFNVLATLPSVASPALLGWYLGGSPIYPVGTIILGLVSVWGPLHLWTLAFAYSKDYNRVEVPMLASVMTRDKASKIIVITLILQVILSYFLVVSTRNFIYLIGASIFNIVILFVGLRFYRERTARRAYLLFKLTAPYIVAILTIYMIEILVK